MIQAIFKKKNGKFYGYKITGHAKYATIGNDIVCAGVSSLYITVTNTLYSFGRMQKNEKDEYIIKNITEKEELCIEMLLDGIRSIDEEYPSYIEVEVIE